MVMVCLSQVKFDFHTGWKCNFNMKTLGDNHIQGFGDCSELHSMMQGKEPCTMAVEIVTQPLK